MNISTSTLLNILSPTINNTIKDKIEKLSVDGKVDIPTLIKDKNIQTLISGLFKDISSGLKTKEDVTTILNNNKNSFSFKNLSEDIKSLVKFLQNTSTINGKSDDKILNQISILKSSIVDIKDLDSKILKSNITNSGIFLESKLAKNSIPILTTIKKLEVLVKNQMDMIHLSQNNIKNIKQLVSQIEVKLGGAKVELPQSIKSDIQNISNNLKALETVKTPELQQPILKDLSVNIKGLENKLLNFNNRVLLENTSNISQNISKDIKTVILQIQEQINQPSSTNELVSKEIKATVEKILSQVEYFQLLSYSTNSNHTYLSFLQDNIEDVDIKFNSSNDDSVSCQINLTLKKQGDLKVLLVLDKQYNLNINIGIEDFEFKQKIQNNLQNLRVGINNIGLMLQSLNVFDINENSSNKKVGGYSSDDNLSFGLDIKV